MGYDKVVDSSRLDAALKYTADRIRLKTGDSSGINFDLNNGFGDAVDEIGGDGGSALFDIVASGGPYPAGDYEFPTLTSITQAFAYSYGNAMSLSFPNVTEMRWGYAFGSTNAIRISMPKLQNIYPYVVSDSADTVTFFAPLATTMAGGGQSQNRYHFSNCSKLKAVVLGSLGTSWLQFYNCSGLRTVDVLTSDGRLDNSFQTGCLDFDCLVLRGDSVLQLYTSTAFDSSKFKSGGSGGNIYIPKSLWDHLGDETEYDYKSATNWSIIDGYETITWLPIEGSVYELEYGDGTPIEPIVDISASFDQGQDIILSICSLDILRNYLSVEAENSLGYRHTTESYILSGTLSVGQSVITVEYGGKTAEFTVIVSDSLDYALYVLSQETVFNGSSDFIDTGIQLMNTDVDFSIFITATNGTISQSQANLLHCMTETSPYPGINIDRSGSIYRLNGVSSVASVTSGVTNRIVVRHEAGSSLYTMDSSTDGAINPQISKTVDFSSNASDKNLLLGCYQASNGTKGRWWAGTIHDCQIYPYTFDDATAIKYLTEEATQ